MALGVIPTPTVKAGITASVTQSQGQQPLVAEINEIATVGSANDTATLPGAATGRRCLIINNGANALQVFPASGDDLGAGVNTATTIASGSYKDFQTYDSTNWEEIGGAGGGGGGWTDDGTVVRLTTATDQVGIGTASPSAGTQLEVAGGRFRILQDNTDGDQMYLLQADGTKGLILGYDTDNTYAKLSTTNAAEYLSFQANDAPLAIHGTDATARYVFSTTQSKLGASLFLKNPTVGASNVVATLVAEGSATPTANDEGFINFQLNDSLGADATFARLTWVATDVISTLKDGALKFGVMVDNTLTDAFISQSDGAVARTYSATDDISTISFPGKFTVSHDKLPTFLCQRTTTSTTAVISGFVLRTKTSGDMADGFGGGFLIQGEDTAGLSFSTSNLFAGLYGIRDGADNQGKVSLATFSGSGTPQHRLQISHDGNVHVSGSTSLAGRFNVDGTADQIQCLIQGHSTQTSDVFVVENSAGTDLMTIDNSGNLDLTGDLELASSKHIKSDDGVMVIVPASGNQAGLIWFMPSGTEDQSQLFLKGANEAEGTNYNRCEFSQNGKATYIRNEELGTGSAAGTREIALQMSGTTGLVVDANAHVGIGASVLSSCRFSIDGDADEIQCCVQGHSTQTWAILNIEDSASVDLFNVYVDGVTIGAANTPATNGGRVICFSPNAADPTMGSNTAAIYAKDVAGTVEMFVVDEADNTTQISPHDPDTGEWVFHSTNARTGRQLRIRMEELVNRLAKLYPEEIAELIERN